MTTPKQRYCSDLKREGFVADKAQKQAVDHLDALYFRLVAAYNHKRDTSFASKMKRILRRKKSNPELGLYLWGGVGRGKTYLMDSFFESLPFESKLRIHFHRFMRRVHTELDEFKGHANPLDKVADKIASETMVICFDEFFVSDITDAMILGKLFEALFARGVCLVATSNVEPSLLYKNGLQRQRFLPAIELIKTRCQVINVDGGTDYRLRTLTSTQLYHQPLTDASHHAIECIFYSLVADKGALILDSEVTIAGRDIPVVAKSSDVIWFDFKAICEGPRSQHDYIDLSCEYHAVVISNIPTLDKEKEDATRRFINLVDEFYDRNVDLVISAEQPLESLYQGSKLVFEFERTKSRLIEMQTEEFLSRAHRSE
jgi:cell division protein ZapE